jgi:hypothetical protein
MRKMGNADKISIIKPEWMRTLVKLRHRWEDNIKINLKEISYEGMDWIYVTWSQSILYGSYGHYVQLCGSL